jgi:putative flippase GtrA
LLYGVVGVLSTLLNILLYRLFADALNLQYLAANALAWIIGLGAVFLANKYVVFESRDNGAKRMLYETATFFTARLISGALDMAVMFIFVDLLGANDFAAKLIDNAVVIIFNYIASKLVIFKRKGTSQ